MKIRFDNMYLQNRKDKVFERSDATTESELICLLVQILLYARQFALASVSTEIYLAPAPHGDHHVRRALYFCHSKVAHRYYLGAQVQSVARIQIPS